MSITPHIDLALILLYAFWVFFFVLIGYLNREGMREGYPVQSEITGRPLGGGLLGLPRPKTFKLDGGVEVKAPHPEIYEEPVNAVPAAPWSGAPLEPVGDPMLSEFGPAAYARRMDVPAVTHTGAPKIAPMRLLPDYSVAREDRDPRGLPVIGGDGREAGTVVDIWIDREEQCIRYLEVELPSIAVDGPPPPPQQQAGVEGETAPTAAPYQPPPAPKRVLLPMAMAKLGGRMLGIAVWRPEVRARSITAAQFVNVPVTRSPDQVSLLEEDKITAYFGAGTLYAKPHRREPLI